MQSFKGWFNKKFWDDRIKDSLSGKSYGGKGPFFYELCGHPWCLRWSRYDHRCGKHQDDP